MKDFLKQFQRKVLCYEYMTPYYGRGLAKQYMKRKTYKVWLQFLMSHYKLELSNLCDPYSCKNDYNPKLALGRSAAAKLTHNTPTHFSFNVTFDSFFTYHNLLKMLKANGIGGAADLRDNRISKCPVKDTEVFGKDIRGTYYFRYDLAILDVRWNDISVVKLTSNCQTLNPVGTSKHYSRSECKTIYLANISLVNYWQNGSKCITLRSTVYSWKLLDTFVMLTSLYEKSPNYQDKSLDLLGFRLETVSIYRMMYSSQTLDPYVILRYNTNQRSI